MQTVKLHYLGGILIKTKCNASMALPQMKQIGLLTIVRSFNWKYPYPKNLEPDPPPEEKLDRNNLVQLEASSLNANELYNKEFINRNPRNLEQMLWQSKPRGFDLDKDIFGYWNKIHFERSAKHVTGKVVHHSGQVVLSASTKEWSIRKHLYSSIDTNAVVNVARILARRCLEAGILAVHQNFSQQELYTQKVQLFLKSLEDEGLRIGELSVRRPKDDKYL